MVEPVLSHHLNGLMVIKIYRIVVIAHYQVEKYNFRGVHLLHLLFILLMVMCPQCQPQQWCLDIGIECSGLLKVKIMRDS